MPDSTLPEDPRRAALQRSAQRVQMYRRNRPPPPEVDERELLRRAWVEYWRETVDPLFRGEYQALAAGYLRLMAATHTGVYELRYRKAALNVADHVFMALECLASLQIEPLDQIHLPEFNQAAADAAYETPDYRARAARSAARGSRAGRANPQRRAKEGG